MGSPYRRPSRQGSRQAASDPREDIAVHMDHYIGIDVGTGSARACIIDSKGDIVGLASENIGLWQPEYGYYVRHNPTYIQATPLTGADRSNPLPIFGAASVPPCTVLSVNITLAPTQSGASGLTPPALSPFSIMKPTSLFR